MKYILDSSVAFKWVVREPGTDEALRLRDECQAAIHQLVAADVFPGEVGMP